MELSRAPSTTSENGIAHIHLPIPKHPNGVVNGIHDLIHSHIGNASNKAGANSGGQNVLEDILIHRDTLDTNDTLTPAEEMLIREQLTRNYSFLGDEVRIVGVLLYFTIFS